MIRSLYRRSTLGIRMAIFNADVGLDSRTLDIFDRFDEAVAVTGRTFDRYSVRFSNGDSASVNGFEFFYPGNMYPSFGTVMSISRHTGGEWVYSIVLDLDQTDMGPYFSANPLDVNKEIFAGDDQVNGSSFKDYINGWSGADRLVGGHGSDTYVVDNRHDTVVELKDQGTDLVKSYVSFSLAGQFIEKLTLIGHDAINASGNSLANLIKGNSAANTIKGNGGADVLVGGPGRDVLTGGDGADRFVFRAVDDSDVGRKVRDQITDFTSGHDLIDLSSIQAVSGAIRDEAFGFIGSDAFSHRAGELRAVRVGPSTVLEGDVTGDARADFQILLRDVMADLHASDFVL
ncbi:M10 family metallopeptidase C-terminal domain-containing protein [Methylobacterium sp. E-045]|uniref:M10 family metallopeptidase C-terminal domain-containing protein n=1 Tax=Methylobacterium sp. E-045 TaxID=2836575 RepID=UPI001FBACB98|nr:M10 family metallopeptidase C-terminal domain-containing protein [Methylobacterium sp. E-045]MCJ2127335.1 M10 family metallopeptidase C-terminal domain-containing protein [Methylobacterium sp. E-045]